MHSLCHPQQVAPAVLQDAATGVLEVDLPAKSPEGWMDYLLMMPQYQLVQGNFGSKTLLERV